MRRSNAARCLAVALVLAATACRPAATHPMVPPTPSPAPSTSLVIGALVNLGDGDATSRQTFEAMSLAVDAINRRGGLQLRGGERRPVRLAAYEDGGSVERVGPDLRRLADEDQAVAIIGPADRDTATVARRLAERLRVPLVTLVATPAAPTDAWRWTFALAADAEAPAAGLVDFLAGTGIERIGWLAPQTSASSEAGAALGRLAPTAGLSVVASETYPLGDEGLATRYARLEAAGAQVVVAWPHDVRGAVSLITQLGPLPNRLPLYLGPAAADPKALAVNGTGVDGLRTVTPRLGVAADLWDHDPLTPLIRDFSRAFRQNYGSLPDDDSAAAWDAVQLIATALGRSGPTRDGLRDVLEQTSGLAGVSGPISFSPTRHSGLDRQAFVVARSAEGRWRLPP